MSLVCAPTWGYVDVNGMCCPKGNVEMLLGAKLIPWFLLPTGALLASVICAMLMFMNFGNGLCCHHVGIPCLLCRRGVERYLLGVTSAMIIAMGGLYAPG